MTRQAGSAGRLHTLLIALIVATAVYLGVSVWAGWEDVLLALRKVGIIGAAIALAMSLINYGLRSWRWDHYLRRGGSAVPWLASLRIYLAGFALTMTPGKAGEAFRAVLLARYGVPYPVTFAALVSERLADLIVILLFALLGLSLYPEARTLVILGALCVAAAVAFLSSARWMHRLGNWSTAYRGKGARLLQQGMRVLQDVRQNLHPGILVPALVLGIVAWGVEGLAFYWILGWMGHEVTLAYALFVYAVSMLAGALSMLPGGMGSAEAVMILMLSHHGIPLPAAIAATVFIRMTTLWFAVFIGLGAMLFSRQPQTGT